MKHNSPELILIKPVVTEKSLIAQANGKYHFWVSLKSNKNQIKDAFTTVFGVEPLMINTVLVKGKNKNVGKKRLPTKKSDRKRAIITIPKDKKIELLSLNTN